MRRWGPGLAILIVLAANAVALAGVLANRRATPEAELTLTERELELPYGDRGDDREDTGLILSLSWSSTDVRWPSEEAAPGWFDRRKLEELGFDCSVPPESADADLFYRRSAPRQAFAVLELEAGAFQEWLSRRRGEIETLVKDVATGKATEEQLRDARKGLDRELAGQSRLFLVDVGTDPEGLRHRYPDRSRHLVVAAVMQLHLYDKPKRLEGHVSRLLISRVHVPRSQRKLLEELIEQAAVEARAAPREPPVEDPGPRGPRYVATVRWGSRLEPWLVSVRPLEQP